MKRQENLFELIGTLDEMAAERGYTLVCSELKEAHRAIREYPALWMEHPKFISQEGEHHGRRRYRSHFALVTREHQPSPIEKLIKRIFLEDTLFEMLESLSQHPQVALIDEVKGVELSLCHNDEVAAAVVAEIEMIF